ncbi:hypothetical protein Tco_0974367 [Tanacetum coccineum]|uniref:Zinc finger, CCHC-type n=1 Tax=Tanacetum coccineum TaxID=301880 RepID=A0ABQ5EBD6_9ASTR
MDEDTSSKKFPVSNFTSYKMTYSRPVMKQYNELLGILGRFTQHKMNFDEVIQVSCIIDKLPPSWNDLKHTLKHQKEELTLIELGSHLLIWSLCVGPLDLLGFYSLLKIELGGYRLFSVFGLQNSY